MKRTENRGFGCSFHAAEVWFKTSFYTFKLIVSKKWSFVQLQASLHKHTDDVVVLIL